MPLTTFSFQDNDPVWSGAGWQRGGTNLTIDDGPVPLGSECPPRSLRNTKKPSEMLVLLETLGLECDI